jgi:hypothetical protein
MSFSTPAPTEAFSRSRDREKSSEVINPGCGGERERKREELCVGRGRDVSDTREEKIDK